MTFKVISEVRGVEVIASGSGVHIRHNLWRRFGRGHWRKLKGFADVLYADGQVWRAELHWYEAHGIGKRDLKVKARLRFLGRL